MNYATAAELAAYLGLDESAITSDDERLIARASEMVDTLTSGRYDPAAAAANVRTYVTRGVCAQVEMMRERGEEVGGPIQSYTAGRVSVTYGAGKDRTAARRIAPRARDAWALAGLLNTAALYRVGVYDED